MKPRVVIQIFVSLFVLAFGGLALYEYYQFQKEREKEEEQSLFLPHAQFHELKDIQINQAGKKLSAVKKEQKWRLIKPVEDELDEPELSRWFDSIKKQKVQKISIEAVEWKKYYLDSSPFVQLGLAGGRQIIFSVSKKSSFDGKYFIKKGEELFIGEGSFYTEINEKNLDDFRNKKIMPSLSHAGQIQFKGKYNFHLSWKDYQWALKGADPKSLPLDFSRLDGFWTDINSLKALSILVAVNSKNLKKYGLNKAQQILHLTYGNKKHVLKISPFKEDKAFVSISHRDYIFEISKEQADKFILPKKEIYDHNFPFRYKTDAVFQLERQAGKNSFKIKKEGEDWKSEKGEAVDAKKLEILLDQIKGLRGEAYKKAINKKPLRFFTVKDEKGNLLFELQEAARSKNRSWLKTNLWPEGIAVSKESLGDIWKKDIFIKQEKKTNDNI